MLTVMDGDVEGHLKYPYRGIKKRTEKWNLLTQMKIISVCSTWHQTSRMCCNVVSVICMSSAVSMNNTAHTLDPQRQSTEAQTKFVQVQLVSVDKTAAHMKIHQSMHSSGKCSWNYGRVDTSNREKLGKKYIMMASHFHTCPYVGSCCCVRNSVSPQSSVDTIDTIDTCCVSCDSLMYVKIYTSRIDSWRSVSVIWQRGVFEKIANSAMTMRTVRYMREMTK